MPFPLRILVVEDDADDRALIVRALEKEFSDLQIKQVATSAELDQALAHGDFDVVSTDYRLGWSDGLTVLDTVKARFPDRPVIMFTSSVSEEVAVEAMKRGVDDYVLKAPASYARLPSVIQAVMERAATIAARKRAETALRESEDRYQTLTNVAPVGIFHADPQGNYLFVNERWMEITGLTMSDACGEGWARAVHIQDRDRVVAEWRDCVRANTPFHSEFRFRRRDGVETWVYCQAAPGRRHVGKMAGYVGAFIDITERKRLEDQLRQSQKIEAIGRLAGGIAHDFNNLLTVILGYSQILLHRIEPSDPRHAQIEQVTVAAERASRLTAQLLAFSRRQMLRFEILDLNAVVTHMEKMLGRLLGEDIELAAVLGKDLGRVRADMGHLEQIIMNLAVNARDAMPEGGKLTIETANVELDETFARLHPSAEPGPYVMLAVSDTGCGMDPATQARAFEPFFTTKEKDKGTGLGLSTVYGIVKQSGGHIWLYSEPGRGTTFKIYLPRVTEAANVAPATPTAQPVSRGSETILLVEDDDAVRELIRAVLTQNGYRVLASREPAEALQLCDTHRGPIHLAMTDMVMPKMSGRELAAQLTQRLPGLKVLHLSGYTDHAIVQQRMLEPGTAFLQKPFTPGALLNKVREVLDRR